MIKLYNVLPELTKEEKRNVSIFLKRTNAVKHRKDVLLFDYLNQNQDNINEKELQLKLYGTTADKNSFYRLKNRLLGDINKSLLQLHYNYDDYNTIINHINLSKIFLNKGKHKLAYGYLVQAEKKAQKNELYDLLDLIYSDLIKLSHETVGFNPLAYIEKRKANYSNLQVLREIDDLLAVLTYHLKTSQNYASNDAQLAQLLQKTIDKFTQNETIQNSKKLQFKIYHAVSSLLLQSRDYKSLEDYLKQTYVEFIGNNLFSRNNHETKLQMLTYLINALFKNDKINESLEVTENLYAAMHEHDGLFYDKYLFYYYNSLVINYQVTNKKKAVEVLLEAKKKKEIQQLSFYTIFVHLNLSVLYFDMQDYKNAKKNIARLKLSDSFMNMDEGFRLKVNIAELLIFYELDDVDLFDYQLKLLNRDFGNLLDTLQYEKDKVFIDTVVKMEQSLLKAKDKIINFIDRYRASSSENDIINYIDWMEAKNKGK